MSCRILLPNNCDRAATTVPERHVLPKGKLCGVALSKRDTSQQGSRRDG